MTNSCKQCKLHCVLAENQLSGISAKVKLKHVLRASIILFPLTMLCCLNYHSTNFLATDKTSNSSVAPTNESRVETSQDMDELYKRFLSDESLICGMCKNVREIKRISNVSSTHFERTYAYSGVPVVVENAMQNWSALSTFDLPFFTDEYAKELGKRHNRNCQFFAYRTLFKSLHQFLATAAAHRLRVPWYVGWSNCEDNAVRDRLRQHYTTPYFLPLAISGMDNFEASKHIWVFMGSTGPGAHMHIDDVGYPSWQAQISGSKKWILRPPPQCYYHCGSDDLEVITSAGDISKLPLQSFWTQTFGIIERLLSAKK